MSGVKVVRVRAGFYEVHDGDKWYTASLRFPARFAGEPIGQPSWYVVNHRGTVLKRGSATYRRVVAAIGAVS